MKNNKLKKAIIFTVAASFSAAYLSCASTQAAAKEDQTELVQEVHVPTPLEIYQEKTEGVSITVISTPKIPTKGKNFETPYQIKVTAKDETPAADFAVTVRYPSSKQDGKVVFAENLLKTDEQGIASFTPEAPAFAFDSFAAFYPAKDSDDEEVAKEAEKHIVSAPFIVQTDKKSAGGVIALVDFNKNGVPVTSNPVSSSTLLMNLMKNGFTKVGNIDLTNGVLKNDVDKLCRDAKSVTGNTATYLIYGTVKYGEVTNADDGITYNLIGELKCLDLKSGTIVVSETMTGKATNKNDWTALTQARQNLSEKFARAIRYGI